MADVLLIGELACGAEATLRALVQQPCRLRGLPGFDDPGIPAAVRESDIVVSNRFLASWSPAGTRLGLVQLHAAGFDNVAVDLLPRGCRVANVRGHERALAEVVMMQVLALARRLVLRDRELRRGVWVTGALDEELEGKTMGIVGFGSVGRVVAPVARAFGMRVLAVKRTPDPALAREHGLEWVGGPDDLHRLLGESDVVVVAVPLDGTSRGLLGAAELAAMKPTAVVVNVARGEVIDEDALYEALAARRIAGAASDVWYGHSGANRAGAPSRRPFHALDNVVMTPHVGARTTGAFRRRWAAVAANIDRFLRGEPIANQVHPRTA